MWAFASHSAWFLCRFFRYRLFLARADMRLDSFFYGAVAFRQNGFDCIDGAIYPLNYFFFCRFFSMNAFVVYVCFGESVFGLVEKWLKGPSISISMVAWWIIAHGIAFEMLPFGRAAVFAFIVNAEVHGPNGLRWLIVRVGGTDSSAIGKLVTRPAHGRWFMEWIIANWARK